MVNNAGLILKFKIPHTFLICWSFIILLLLVRLVASWSGLGGTMVGLGFPIKPITTPPLMLRQPPATELLSDVTPATDLYFAFKDVSQLMRSSCLSFTRQSCVIKC